MFNKNSDFVKNCRSVLLWNASVGKGIEEVITGAESQDIDEV